jgi:3-hydroxyisobutyrate dehydrogenase
MMRRFHTARLLSSAASSHIGFIGLGNMGAHMARNLLKAGHKVVVFDLNPAAVDSLKQSGAEV